MGLLQGPSGYADEARGFLRVLEAAGFAPAARELINDGTDAHLDARARDELRRQMARVPDPGAVVVHHYAPAWARQTPVVAGAPNVARTMFETDAFPTTWRSQLLRRDEVWVPSAHGLDAFERGGVPSDRLRIVPGTLDFDVFDPGAEPLELEGVPEGHFTFLSNFAFSERKAWRQLLQAWARAFAPTDPVCLVLKTGAPQGRIEEALAGIGPCAPVVALNTMVAPSELARLYAAADAYVLASRGEGWGRPYMEALAMGLPTIASNWSGNTEFMRPETSWLVDGELVAIPDDHDTFADDVSDQRWFEPDLGELAAALADVASDPEAARRRAAPAREDLIERFGPEATANVLGEALAAVAARDRRMTASGRGVVIRGPFGRNASLALVNDRLLSGLEAGGRRVMCRVRSAPVEPIDAPTINHSWPPDFTPAGDGPTAVVLPWESGHPPLDWVQKVRREVDLVMVPSEYVRSGYIAGGMPPGLVEVVPNGVDLDRFRADGPALEFSAGCVFLFVGGTIWRKGVDLLLDAWTRAFAPGDDVLLVIKGFGADTHYRNQSRHADVEEFVARDDIAPALYLGEQLAFDELPALYRAADALVAPYRGEGFGLPILEAMACGVPAVHTALGPSREFCGEDAGWAVQAERFEFENKDSGPMPAPAFMHQVDVDALARTLREVAADPAERARRGAAAAAAAQGYGWDAAAEAAERALARLEAEKLPLARHIAPAALETRREAVLLAPESWGDVASWSDALAAWAGTVDQSCDATLVLAVPAGEAEAVAASALGRLAELGFAEALLPDLLLHPMGPGELASLVAGCDAVLLDAGQAAERPAALCRRAGRVLTADDVADFAACLPRLRAAA